MDSMTVKGYKKGLSMLTGNENLEMTLKGPLTSLPFSVWPNCYSPLPRADAITRP